MNDKEVSQTENRPQVIIIAGPNGAGKSTTAPRLLRDTLAVDEFVNADVIAYGLSAFAPEKAALEAGKIMLRRLRDLAAKRMNFAFETTLASRSFASWLAKLANTGYGTHLVFLTLPDVDFAIQRVAKRVTLGGHAIDEQVIRRRYISGLHNLFNLYMPVVSSWKIYDNSVPGAPMDIAECSMGTISIRHEQKFTELRKRYRDG